MYKCLDFVDDSILASLSFKDITDLNGKKARSSQFLSEKLAENFERVKTFHTRVESGEDQCMGRAHNARFLRGYVGNSQELWLQARRHLGLTGLDPISNYETVSIGLNGHLSSRVWHEVHSPSSKILSLRMLTPSAMKSAWVTQEKAGEIKEFDTLHDLKMAVMALDTCVRKVFPWNFAFTTLAIFLQSVNFGEKELDSKPDRLIFLADFVDEVIRYNAQAWDEERHFMSAQEVAAKWTGAMLRRGAGPSPSSDGPAAKAKKAGNGNGSEKKDVSQNRDRFPPGVCKQFQNNACTHTGDKHAAHWDSEYVLRHLCARYLPEKKRWCLGNHSKKDHKDK
jgi:hypothetical protein